MYVLAWTTVVGVGRTDGVGLGLFINSVMAVGERRERRLHV
jgi:hypothetical protein